jgi:hypothetical protein
MKNMVKSIKSYTTKLRGSRPWPLFIELGLLVIIAAAFIIEMAHIAETSWQQLFLYSGDSLTLPVIYKSIQLHEPIKWVFSAQLNLFPEGILFAIALLFGHAARQALFFNALVNILVIYGLIRLFLKTATRASLHQRQLFGLVTMLIIFVCLLLELPSDFGQTMVTYMLFNTYYSGPLFTGLLGVSFIAWQLRQPQALSHRGWWLTIGMALLSLLTIASNPIYIIQFSLPFLITIGVVYWLREVKRDRLVTLLWPQLIPIILALFIRQVFLKPFIGQDATSHLSSLKNLLDWRVSFDFMIGSVAPVLESFGTRIRIFISVGLYFSCLFSMLHLLNKKQKGLGFKMHPEKLFAALFVILEPIVLAACLYDGAATPDRYLINSFVVLFLAIPLLADVKIKAHYKRLLVWATVTASIVIVVLSGVRLPALRPFWASSDPDETCLAQALNYQPANGLADYWVARPLDIYNTHGERVLQSKGSNIYPWLNNIADYQGKYFTFYVVQRNAAFTRYFTPRDIVIPRYATSTTVCSDFTVYHYVPGSRGYTLLNATIQKSLDKTEKARQDGTLAGPQL